MLPRSALAFSFATTLAGLAAVACTSSDGGASCKPYTTSIDLKTPTVSFKNDVMPVLQQSCMFTSCHGGGSGSLTMVSGDPTTTRKNLVDVPAPQLASMKIVAPGDPSNSYMMKKMDGDICTLASQCTPPCTDTMPQGGDLLDVGDRDKVRRWIAQGAADD